MRNERWKGHKNQVVMEDILKAKSEPAFYNARGWTSQSRQSLCCFICEYATSHVQAHAQLEPPLSGGAHSTSRAVLIKLILLSHCMWAVCSAEQSIHRRARILLTQRYTIMNTCKGWVHVCMGKHTDDGTHRCWLHECFCTHMNKQWQYIYIGWAKLLSLSFLHWMGKGCQQFLSVNSWEMLFCG